MSVNNRFQYKNVRVSYYCEFIAAPKCLLIRNWNFLDFANLPKISKKNRFDFISGTKQNILCIILNNKDSFIK